MTHAMVETAPGKVLDFNSNCSSLRGSGHSAFGWVEYRFSEDYGENFGEIHVLSYSMDTLLEGVNTISVEKAVVCDDGTVAAFCHRNTSLDEGSCEPFSEPTLIRSSDGGKTWSEPTYFFPYAGRIYDAKYRDGVIYVLLFCNDASDTFTGTKPEHLYRLYKSEDNGENFYEASVVAHPSSMGLGYGSLVFMPDGKLIAYAYDIKTPEYMPYAISDDGGKTWKETGKSLVAKKIRNPQINVLDGQYILHGRANATGFVLYTSADGLHWDEGHMLNGKHFPEQTFAGCYYSNNLVLDNPGKPGEKRMLMQYSELYNNTDCCVNVMHLWITSVK